MDSWTKDVTQALRSLRKQPGFALTAILTLALGIGATAAIFSVVDAVLLRPLPYRDAGRLVHVAHDLNARNVVDFPFAPADFADVRSLPSPFEQVEAVRTFLDTFPGDEAGREAERVPVALVTTGFIRLLGFNVAYGRDFNDADGTPLPPPPLPVPGAQPADGPPTPPAVTILSHEFWQRRFSANPAVVGSVQQIGGESFQIVGVLAPRAELLFPPNINIQRAPQMWISDRTDFAQGSRLNVSLRVIGRLKEGMPLSRAQSELDVLATDLRRRFPIKETAGLAFRLAPVQQDLVDDVRPVILSLMGAVVLVLLIACANVANLLLVRTAARGRELAVRTALGATRGRLISQMLIESLVLSVSASAIGLILARMAIAGLAVLAPGNVPRLDTVSIDPRVVGFGVGLAVLSMLVFGLLPAIRASRPNVMDVLRRAGRSDALAQGRWIRSGVVIAEVALSFVLLVGSGLMMRSVVALNQANPGFNPDGMLTFLLTNQGQVARSPEAARNLSRDLGARLRAVPGVTAVTATSFLPLSGGQEPLTRYGKEEALADPGKFQQANAVFIRPGFFDAMGTSVIDGRVFNDEDNVTNPRGIVIDSVMAAKMFGTERAVGQRLFVRTVRNEPDPFEVIGVVGHQRAQSPAVDSREALYFPEAAGGGNAAGRWVVRTSGNPAALEAAVRREIASLDARLGVFEVKTMGALVDEAAAGTRFVLWLLSLFAGVAMALAAVGLYSVLSTAVRQRTAEIGVRMAFGATTRGIFALIVGYGLKLSAAGVVLGALGAAILTRAIGGMLVGVSATDPLTYTAIAAAFFVVAALACGVPAFRASRLDPLTALRQD